MAPPLVAVAHGSRDPRSAATISALVEVVRARNPELDVRAAFLDLRKASGLRAIASKSALAPGSKKVQSKPRERSRENSSLTQSTNCGLSSSESLS